LVHSRQFEELIARQARKPGHDVALELAHAPVIEDGHAAVGGDIDWEAYALQLQLA
jgi:hypothetical protein